MKGKVLWSKAMMPMSRCPCTLVLLLKKSLMLILFFRLKSLNNQSSLVIKYASVVLRLPLAFDSEDL